MARKKNDGYMLKSEVLLIIQNYIRTIQMNDYSTDSGIPQLYKAMNYIDKAPTADVVEVKHGHWDLEIKNFYSDNWDESIELVVYILAKCSCCGQWHHPKEIFSKSYYAPEDAPEDFEFNVADKIAQALNEFYQQNYKFQNYCPECGARMDGDEE